MHDYSDFFLFRYTAFLQKLHHLLCHFRTSCQIIRHVGRIIVFRIHHRIDQNDRQLITSKILRSLGQTHAVSRTENNGIRLFRLRIKQHGALQLPVAILIHAAYIDIDPILFPCFFHAGNHFFPIAAIYGFHDSIDILLSAFHRGDCFEILLRRCLSDLLRHRALRLSLIATPCDPTRQNTCRNKKCPHFFISIAPFPQKRHRGKRNLRYFLQAATMIASIIKL